jgi:hypothetical protein
MTPLSALLVPILISAVVVFVASSILHMATPWHKNDFLTLANQDSVMGALRQFSIPPGDYFLPKAASMDEMKTPEFTAKMTQGPVVLMTVVPGGPISMGKPLAQWFLFSVVVSLFAAYAAGVGLAPGTPYMTVFRVVFTATFAGYALGVWPFRIWYRRSLGTTIRATIDGVIYAALTAGVFGWRWPQM